MIYWIKKRDGVDGSVPQNRFMKWDSDTATLTRYDAQMRDLHNVTISFSSEERFKSWLIRYSDVWQPYTPSPAYLKLDEGI